MVSTTESDVIRIAFNLSKSAPVESVFSKHKIPEYVLFDAQINVQTQHEPKVHIIFAAAGLQGVL